MAYLELLINQQVSQDLSKREMQPTSPLDLRVEAECYGLPKGSLTKREMLAVQRGFSHFQQVRSVDRAKKQALAWLVMGV